MERQTSLGNSDFLTNGLGIEDLGVNPNSNSNSICGSGVAEDTTPKPFTD